MLFQKTFFTIADGNGMIVPTRAAFDKLSPDFL
jgi:hypothetical protein